MPQPIDASGHRCALRVQPGPRRPQDGDDAHVGGGQDHEPDPWQALARHLAVASPGQGRLQDRHAGRRFKPSEVYCHRSRYSFGCPPSPRIRFSGSPSHSLMSGSVATTARQMEAPRMTTQRTNQPSFHGDEVRFAITPMNTAAAAPTIPKHEATARRASFTRVSVGWLRLARPLPRRPRA